MNLCRSLTFCLSKSSSSSSIISLAMKTLACTLLMVGTAMLMTQSTMAVDFGEHRSGATATTGALVDSISQSLISRQATSSPFNKIYLALYEYALEQPKIRADSGVNVVDISPVVAAFLAQFRDDVVKYDRYTFLFPDLHGEFPDSSRTFKIKADFTNGTVTGAHTLDIDGQANMTILENGNLQLDIPLRIITGDLDFNVDLNIGALGPGKGRIQGVIIGPGKYILGMLITPWELRINELRILYKAKVDADVTGWEGFIKLLEFAIYFAIVLIVLLVLLIVLCVYLVFRLKKQSKYIKSLK